MPKISPIVDLVDWLATAGVLNLREAHALRRRCEELGSGVELEQVIAGLAAQKKLTKYQAAEIRAGRYEELVQGNYLLLDLIRSSQMGVVYRARQTALHHEVALKILPEHVARAPDAEARFRREVEAIARLKHPRIVAACDAGRMGRTLYLAMEYIEGENLGDYVRRQGKLPLRDALRCIVQAAEGLAVAHAAGIVHRDVKPSNLMLTTQGEIKVLDLGLARFLAEEKGTGNLTASEDLTGGGLLGTIDFMAPEQSRDSRKADHRADIYGLGCTLYYLLASVPPTPPGDWPAKLAWHQSAPIPRLASVCPAAPQELQEMFDKMLARDVRQRYASCDELRRDLSGLLTQGEGEAPGALRPGAAVANRDPLPAQFADLTQTDVVDQAHVETKDEFAFSIQPSARASRVAAVSASSPDRRSPSKLVLGIAGGVGAGVVILGIILLAFFLTREPNARRTTAAKPIPAEAKEQGPKLTRSFLPNPESPRIPRAPQDTQWNRELKSEIDRLFVLGTDGDAGRTVYSEADSAMEQFLNGDWFIGSALTSDGEAVQFQVRQGKFFTAMLTPEQVAARDLQGQSIQRSSDTRLKLRYRPLLKITAAELSLVPGSANTHRVRGRVQTEALQDVPLSSVSFALDTVVNTSDKEGTQQVYVPLEWTKTESGWHVVESSESLIPIPSRFNYRLYVMGWSWSPKPGIFRLTPEHQGRFVADSEENK